MTSKRGKNSKNQSECVHNWAYYIISDSGHLNYFPIAISKNERSILSEGRFGINGADSAQNEAISQQFQLEDFWSYRKRNREYIIR